MLDESTEWRCKEGRIDGILHMSDIRVITTAGVDTHFDFVITTPQPCENTHSWCATSRGDAAKKALNDKMFIYRRCYDFPERRLAPIANEIYGRWHLLEGSGKVLKQYCG